MKEVHTKIDADVNSAVTEAKKNPDLVANDIEPVMIDTIYREFCHILQECVARNRNPHEVLEAFCNVTAACLFDFVRRATDDPEAAEEVYSIFITELMDRTESDMSLIDGGLTDDEIKTKIAERAKKRSN